ncbi:hypothetical protein CS379_10445, partial [Methylobacterium frigidaeris]
RFHLQAKGGSAMAPIPSHSTHMLNRKLESIARLSDEERQAITRLPVSVRSLSSTLAIFGDVSGSVWMG